MHLKILRILVHCIVFSYIYVILNVQNKLCPLKPYSLNKDKKTFFLFLKRFLKKIIDLIEIILSKIQDRL